MSLRPKISVIDNEERGKQIDELIGKIFDLFNEYDINNMEAIWVIEHIKKQILDEDLESD